MESAPDLRTSSTRNETGPPGPKNEEAHALESAGFGNNESSSADKITATRALVQALEPITARVYRGHCARYNARKGHYGAIPEPLDDFKIAQHVAQRGKFGAYPVAPGESTTRIAVLDFDDHVPKDKDESSCLGWETTRELTRAVVSECAVRGLRPIPFRSSGGRGIHLFFLWDGPQDAYSVRELLREVLADCLLRPGAGGLVGDLVEIFPAQDSVPPEGCGNLFALPLAGKSVPLDDDLNPLSREAVLDPSFWHLSNSVPFRERPVIEPKPVEVPPKLETLRSALAAIPNGVNDSLDYDDWRGIGFGLHNATSGSDEGLALFHEFSSRSPKYDADFIDNRFWPYVQTARENPITVRTIYAKAREHGWQEPVIDDFDVVAPAEERTARQRFEVLTADVFCAQPSPPWIVKGVLPVAELAVVFGQSGSGKSFFVLDLVTAVARGTEWCGLKTRKGRVLYIAAEGAGGFRKRLKAYGQQYGVPLKELPRVIDDRPNLMSPADTKLLIERIEAAGGADVIAIDTLAQTISGANENSGEDMGKALAHCDRLHRATGAMIVLIHHAGKDDSKGARGWSGLKAAADVEIEVSRNENERQARISKSKDGEDGALFAFRLLPVVIGQDEEGDDITSCVIEHVAAVERTKQHVPRGAWERPVWEAAQVVANGAAVPVEALIAEVLTRIERPVKGRDRRREKIKAAIHSLAEKGRLRLDGEHVTSTNAPHPDGVANLTAGL